MAEQSIGQTHFVPLNLVDTLVMRRYLVELLWGEGDVTGLVFRKPENLLGKHKEAGRICLPLGERDILSSRE